MERTATIRVAALTPDQVAELREVFNLYDRNGDGTIDAFELSKVFKGMNINMSPEDVAELVSTVDKDGSGSIDFPDFCKMMATYFNRSDEDELLEVFEKLSSFLSREPAVKGQYSPDELETIMHVLGEHITTLDFKQMLRQAKAQGVMTYKIFHEIMRPSGAAQPVVQVQVNQ